METDNHVDRDRKESIKVFENRIRKREEGKKFVEEILQSMKRRCKNDEKKESFLLQEIGIFLLLLDIIILPFRIYFHPSLKVIIKMGQNFIPAYKNRSTVF